MAALRAHGLKSLRAKIAIPFAILVILAIMVPGFIAVHQAIKTLTARAEETQLLAAQLAANHLTHLLRDQISTVEGIAKLESLREMAPAKIDADIRKVRLYEKTFTSLIVIDPEGKIVSFVDKPWNVGKSLAQREYFQIALHQGRTHISDSILTLDKTITVAVSSPIRNDRGQIVGVLAGTFDVHHRNFNAVVLDTKIGAAGYAYLVDQKGIIIAHPETERTLGQENFAHYGVVQKVLAGNSGVGLYYYKGIEMLGAYVPVEPSGWGVIVQQPLAAANAPAIKLRHLMVTVVIVSVIIAVFLGVLIAHRISTPLARLESSAATIATGNLEEPVPALGQDEIGRLAKTFDGMRLSLEESKGQLEKANETLKVLLDATPATVLLLDPEGIVLAANAMVARRLGKTVQEIMGTCIYSHMPPDLAETRKARVDEMKLSGQPVHFEDMRENRHLDNYIHPIFTPTGDLACFAVLSLDITERKQAEAARQESEERLRLFIEYAPAALAMLDKEMRYLSVSRRWLVDYGSGDRDILGLSHYEIFPELPERWKEAHRRGLAGEVVRSESDCFKRSDGSVQWERWEVRPWYDTAGEVGGILILTEDITARQQAEAERDRLFNLSLDMFCIGGFDGFFKQVNPAGEKLLGWTGQELLRKPWIEFVHPEDRAASMVAAEQLAAGEVVSAFENRFQCRDGSYRWFSWNALPLLEEGLIFCVGRDVTERKQADEALSNNYRELHETAQRLEQSRSMLQLIIESIPIRVFWKDSELRYLGCNTLFARDAGLSQPDQLLGKDDFAMGWREQAEVYQADDRQVMESRRPKMNIVEPQTTPSGAKIWLNTSKVPLQMPDGEVFGVLGVYEDITARYHAEEALRQSEEKFRLVFEKAPLGIMHYDRTSTITDCNEKFAEIIGTSKDKFIGFNMIRQLNDDKMREAVAASLRGEVGYYEGDYLSVTAKNLTPVRAIYQPIFSSDGVLSGGVALFEDVSERQRAESERLQFNKLESLGTLAGGIAHDFNNILTAILGNIGLAALDDKIGLRVQDRLAQAEAACLRAQALSQQLLTFAKGGAPVKKLFSVTELLTESTAFSCVGSPVKCETSFPDNLWSIEADPGQIGQVFQNLTINAIQAMPNGGTIKVWGENLTPGTSIDLPLSAGKYIKISVRDQGIGIPAEHLPRIFDPYFTTKQRGSGLGLASAYAIIKKHHGHIAVESEPGVETTFFIYLPAVEQQAPPQPAEDREPLVGKGKILVMDDEEMVREVLGRILARLGYEAEFAGDGGEAIEKFVQAHGSGQRFAGVILDLTVPGGLGGKETMARLLEIDPETKGIVSSGYADDPIMADFQKYGFSGVIAKPYKISELGKILHEVTREKL